MSWSILSDIYNAYSSILTWVGNVFTLIRSNPFLLFTVGFVVLGYTIMILGRMLSRE